jgi:hypothetical protein
MTQEVDKDPGREGSFTPVFEKNNVMTVQLFALEG